MNSEINNLVSLALKEDLPQGDLTTDALELNKKPGKAELIAKQDLTLSGTLPFEETFHLLNSTVKVQWAGQDGKTFKKNEVVCVTSGPLDALLKGERTALNFLGHLSGIATLTARFVKEAPGTTILDTRKTLPGLRALEKAAVVHGGGKNHRMNLSDGILIKENHIRAAGSIENAVKKVREKWGKISIEVEVTNMAEIVQALDCKVERLLLDNMTAEEIEKAVKLIDGRALTEASGNMTLDRVRTIAKLGVNFISVGSLTHSAPSADLSMLFYSKKG